MAKDSNAQRTARKAAQRIINERQETRKIYRLLFTNRNRTKNVLLKNSAQVETFTKGFQTVVQEKI